MPADQAEPDFIYDPENWETTYSYEDRLYLTD
jgi:hypothetical protein